MRNSRIGSIVLIIVILLFGRILMTSIDQYYEYLEKTDVLNFSELIKAVDEGNIKEILINESGSVKGEYRAERHNRLFFVSQIRPSDESYLTEKLLKSSPVPKIIKEVKADSLLYRIISAILSLLPFIIVLGFFMFIMRSQTNIGDRISSFGRIAIKNNKLRPRKRFEDVAGADEAKENLSEIVEFLKNPMKFRKLGGRIPKGVLLIGSAGVGKTLLAKAVAGEAGVPFLPISGSEFVEMFVGVGASRIRDLFRKASAQAPSIIFIDEIDAIGKRNQGINTQGNDERGQTINQLLVEMDGFDSDKGVIVIAATNEPDQLDSALLRPGRFDRRINVSLPDIKGRYEILKIHTRIPVIISPELDLMNIARITPGFSGADLANLVNEAALIATRKNKEHIEYSDFYDAKERITMGAENKSLSSVLSDEDKRVTAYHEAGHALIAILTPESDPLYKVSIIPRGKALGITSQFPEKDRYNYTEGYLLGMLSILYGGRAAEKIVFEKISTGAQNDIERATEIAKRMVCEFGMSRLGPINFKSKIDHPLNSYDASEETRNNIDSEIKELINKAYNTAYKLLTANRPNLDKIAQALIERETLTKDEIMEIIKI